MDLGRKPSPIIETNNIIIICLGLTLLIVPVLLAVVWMCVHKKVFQSMRNVALKNNNFTDSILPYSRFPSSPASSSSSPSRPERPTLAITVPNDVRVLVYKENAKSKSELNGCRGIKNKVNENPDKAEVQLRTQQTPPPPPYVITDDIGCTTPTFVLPPTPPAFADDHDTQNNYYPRF